MIAVNNFLFKPTQPEMLTNCLKYIEHQPNSNHNTDVSLYYQFTLDERSHGSLPIIPDGCIDLLFGCHPSDPFAMIAVSPEQRCAYQFNTQTEYFGVRFFPEQSCLKLQCSMKELIQHQQLPLFDVMKMSRAIVEEIALLPSFQERVRFFHSFIKSKLLETDYNQTLIKYCLEKIYTTHGLLNMNQLSLDTGYSDRYLRKKFEDYIGFSPKLFSQIVRLQNSVQELLTNDSTLNNIIDNHGFYDNAHFYKGFKKFMSLTPQQYKALQKLKSPV